MRNAKIISLGAGSLILLALNWWIFNVALYQQNSLEFWIWPILVSILWIAVFNFFVMVNVNRWLFFLINTAGLMIYLLLLPKNLFVLAGGVIFFLFAWMYQNRIRSEEKSRMDFSLRRIMAASIMLIIYGLLLLLGFNFYSTTSTEFKSNPDWFYSKLSEQAAKSTLATGSSSQPLGRASADYLTAQLRQTLKNYEQFFPLIFTLIILALLRSFAFVFNWLAILISYLLFRLLLIAGFFRISKVPVEVEKLEI